MAEIKLTLPATASHKPRTVTYRPHVDATLPGDATICVTESTTKRIIKTCYHCEETQAPGRLAYRRFLILKADTNQAAADTVAGRLADERCGNVYEVILPERGNATCTCEGNQAGKRDCVHLLALKAIVKQLDHPQANSEADHGSDRREFAGSTIAPPGQEIF